MTWLLALATHAAFAAAPAAKLACPPGMVLVQGAGTLGIRGQPYGIVETAQLKVVDAPEKGCPAALAATPGASTCWVQTDMVDPVLRPRDVTVEPFCIERHPFPGKGARYTRDGMTAWDAATLGELLETGRFGARRLCTMTEFQAAVAGLQSNLPFVYGAIADPARCPGSSLEQNAVIGTDPACQNPETGVHEYGAVLSHWVLADQPFVARACDAPPCRGAGNKPIVPGMLIVAGGTARMQTRQAPLTPHTWHDHGDPKAGGCDEMGHDDQPVICADPRPGYAGGRPFTLELEAGEAAWQAVTGVARQRQSMTAALEAGLGREVCGP